MAIHRVIVCVDCGGKAHLLHEFAPDDPPRPGDVVAYRCEECLDRWDLVVDAEDLEPEEPPGQLG